MRVKELKDFLKTVDDNKEVRFITTEWDRLSCEDLEVQNFEVESLSQNDYEVCLEINNDKFLRKMHLK